MNKLLIQPTIDSLQQYEDYAKKIGCNFEVVDFAFPNIISSDYKSIIERYKSESRYPENIIASHGAFIDVYINSPDPSIKKVSEDRIVQSIKIAQKLGAKFIIFHTNSLPMMEKEFYYQTWTDNHIVFWKEIVQKYDITILLENMWDKSPKWIAKVIERVNSPNLKALLDTGHVNVFSEVPIKTWFEQLGKNIVYIHLNDNMGDADIEVPPGQGSIKWGNFDQLVNEYCDNPLLCIEVKDMDSIKKSVKYLTSKNIYPFSN